MARDGIPNKLLQKILRELKVMQLVVDLVQLPFQKGVALDKLAGNDDYKQLLTLINLLYRLLKMMAKNSLRASRLVVQQGFLAVFRSQLGKGILVTPTVKEIFENKRELLNQISPDVVNHFVDLLQKDKAPQYIDFLMSVCVVTNADGTTPLSRVQNMVLNGLLEKNPHLLPRYTYQHSVTPVTTTA